MNAFAERAGFDPEFIAANRAADRERANLNSIGRDLSSAEADRAAAAATLGRAQADANDAHARAAASGQAAQSARCALDNACQAVGQAQANLDSAYSYASYVRTQRAREIAVCQPPLMVVPPPPPPPTVIIERDHHDKHSQHMVYKQACGPAPRVYPMARPDERRAVDRKESAEQHRRDRFVDARAEQHQHEEAVQARNRAAEAAKARLEARAQEKARQKADADARAKAETRAKADNNRARDQTPPKPDARTKAGQPDRNDDAKNTRDRGNPQRADRANRNKK
jgi:hypothetical protein